MCHHPKARRQVGSNSYRSKGAQHDGVDLDRVVEDYLRSLYLQYSLSPPPPPPTPTNNGDDA